MSDGRDLAILIECYTRLLRLPFNGTRHRIQPALASLRDEIAYISPGWSAQHVQETCESVAALMEGRDG